MCFGTLVAYIVAVGDLITPILMLTPVKNVISGDMSRELSMTFFWLFIMAPLSILERINSLRFTSFLGVVAIFFLAIVTTITSVQDLENNGFQNSWGRAQLITLEWYNIIQAVPIIMFAFTCQINVIPIYNELESHSARRMGKVTFRSVMISFTVYLLMGVFGYLNCKSMSKNSLEVLLSLTIKLLLCYLHDSPFKYCS
jgi:amino acid permease